MIISEIKKGSDSYTHDIGMKTEKLSKNDTHVKSSYIDVEIWS